MKDAPSWMDRFLAIDVLIVSLLVFVDFLLGKEGRAKIRDRVGWWWLKADDLSYVGILSAVTKAYRNAFDVAFGADMLESYAPIKRFAFSLVLGGIVAVAVWHYGDWIYSVQFSRVLEREATLKRTDIAARVFLGMSLQQFFEGLKSTLILNVIFASFVGLLSLATLRSNLNKLAASFTWRQLSLLLLLSSGYLIAVLIVEFALLYYSTPPIRDYFFHDRGYEREIASLATYSGRLAVFWSFIPMTVVLLSPTVIYVCGLLIAISTKAASWLLKPTISLLLRRLYESEKGVLTLVAAFLGAAAKILHEILK